MNVISFNLNVSGIVYIAIPDTLEFMPLDTKLFKKTGETLSLLKISQQDESNLGTLSEIHAIEDQGMEIFRAFVDEGRVQIALEIPEGTDLKLLLWVGRNNAVPTFICGGTELWVSDTTSPYYKGCSASSQADRMHECSHGLNDSFEDNDYQIWKSDSEGIGAYLQAEFKNTVKVS